VGSVVKKCSDPLRNLFKRSLNRILYAHATGYGIRVRFTKAKPRGPTVVRGGSRLMGARSRAITTLRPPRCGQWRIEEESVARG